MAKLTIIILAAGKGTRMMSDTPKVLHLLGGKPIIKHIIDTAKQLTDDTIHLVCGYASQQIIDALSDESLHFIQQQQQLGTGHAVKQALPYINDDDDVLILYGDVPLISATVLKQLHEIKPQQGIALLTAYVPQPKGYGRIIRQAGEICAIVEEKDANLEQKNINEINTGILIADGKNLKHWINNLSNDNVQQEYYLTDIIKFAYQQGKVVTSVHPDYLYEIEGINDRVQLATMERLYQKRTVENLMVNGVTFYDPNRFDLRGELIHGKDVTIDCNVIIEGHVTLGNHVVIGAGSFLKNCSIADHTVISPYTIIENSQIDKQCTIGPFARLRPGTRLSENVHIGNFVETKNAILGKGTKSGHLTYLGDAEIGQNVNIGAGTITCNYDGANKHKTHIGDNVFVGSDTQFVAPVSVANGATIGAGTTVTDDIDENELVISRVRQKHIAHWQRPKKRIK